MPDKNFIGIPPQAFVDRTDLLSGMERGGVFREITRKVTVCGLTDNDYNVLYSALQVPGVPQPGDPLSFPNVNNNVPMLRCVERHASLVDPADTTKVQINCVYRHVLDGAQELLEENILFGKIHTSLTQKDTNFYTDFSDPLDPVNVQIVVSHRFPGAPILIPGPQPIGAPPLVAVPVNADPQYPNQVITQSGTINVFVPQKTYVVEFYVNLLTLKPTDVELQLIQCVNKEEWMNGQSYTWLCQDVAYECVDINIGPLGRWRFKIEWQYNPDTWFPGVVFEDKRTGQPPPNLVKNLGYWDVPYYFPVNFNDAFLPDYHLFFADDPG